LFSIYSFIVVVILYGLLGFLYQRLVLGAKGKEQIPNYSFWQDFGNLQAVSLILRLVKKRYMFSNYSFWKNVGEFNFKVNQ
jgi:hypothetical protein